ncbi:aldo/keto reductase [Klebsiella sp. RHBSTW-00484]|uniref:aldo/keto reductase n=1 Tax=unclassified Klebsiella TaxID=2608929 RepID=UPI0015E56B26|nr:MULTISPECIES: aldo/keto reductase [unclassified Klebsiella]MBA7846711.1 aldo/keto reductase [Klebsiella sp. RHBSTW-00465]QLO37413.1 aldo/keto reductase [Klebsiella sp. RHBSTW-00484]QLT76931.1 aldo/keto reductase [Klebsiella sp. RHBSTW-00464]
MAERTIRFGEHDAVPVIGQGTWYMGENQALHAQEVAALRAGIELGLAVIDTAEMYADGGAEEVVSEAIRGQRDRVVLVSKVYPWNAGGRKIASACEASLRRLNTDYLDLYLLHWRGDYSLQETVEGMEGLVVQGKIRRWGVSNLDYDDMQQLWQVDGGEQCATNQVLYHLASRGIEHDLLPWCQQQRLPVMAYCPLAQAGRLRNGLLNHTVVKNIAEARGITAAQVLLAWVISHQGVLAIPKAASIEHVEQNAAALEIVLSAEELALLDKAYPAPGRKTPLDMV